MPRNLCRFNCRHQNNHYYTRNIEDLGGVRSYVNALNKIIAGKE